MEIIALLLSIVFIFLAGLHFYWAIFGIKEPEAVLPTEIGSSKVKSPGKLVSVLVGFILLFFAFVFINKVLIYVDKPWVSYIPLVIGIIFILRAFGDFKYIGFFKTAKNSKFSALDTRYYSPLCLFLGALIFILEFLG
ncbi:DUF3995 domain-containing protein [Muricauda sp. CAU 1633]|uniref:DUF3995 domain-containing protein n=1 Tax=Allomuricauda sp. CAU 1633 TaxID=2816036 RepID=UPI001A8F6761|nr:DUF3995 domain-containing protein [Muricauda sp. CAU 1633]MBO0322005.1 DUF3995 domain-containing protein [Muricauda sp. CAU 1633]